MEYNNEPYTYPYTRRREPSIFDGFTLRPLPYTAILILIVICVFLGLKLYSSYEEVAENAESQVNWLLLATPLLLIFAVKWLSSIQEPGNLFGFSGSGRRKWASSNEPAGSGSSGNASPWVVAALIVLVLVLVHYQSAFLDSWFG